jgi:tocopherol cyclase
MGLKNVRAIFHPDQYHGWGRDKNFFELWYYKIFNATENVGLAVIPGISIDEKGNKEVSIQILDGQNKLAKYYEFPAETFVPKRGVFELKIGNNFFSGNKIILDLPSIKGELTFHHRAPWKGKLLSPGIMGPYSFIPRMECYHDILTMYSEMEGELVIEGETVNFTHGRGFIEKDWGRSLPTNYIAMQSSHFSEKEISIKISIAEVPWMKSSFVGFIVAFWFNNQMVQFNTYNRSKIKKCSVEGNVVRINMINPKHRIEIIATRDSGTQVQGPINGLMTGKITESMTSELRIKLFERKTGKMIFNDTGGNAGLEICGDLKAILSHNEKTLAT